MEDATNLPTNKPSDLARAAIMLGAEMHQASSKEPKELASVLGGLVVDLYEGKAGALEQVGDLLRLGVEALANDDEKDVVQISFDLHKAVRSTPVHAQLRKIFVMWPNLKIITERFCHYVTPLPAGSGDASLLEESLMLAAEAFHQERDEANKAKAYIYGLTELAHRLTCISIKGKYSRGYVTWLPFSMPISDWIRKYRIKTIKTVERACPCPPETARILLLTHILTIDDFGAANLKLASETLNA